MQPLSKLRGERLIAGFKALAMAATATAVASCQGQAGVATVAIANADAVCDQVANSGHISGDHTDPTIDFKGGTATVVGSDGMVYRGDIHPLFSGAGDSAEVSFAGDVTAANGRAQHLSGRLSCRRAAASLFAPGATADVIFGGRSSNTCPAGSIPAGFGAGYLVSVNADGSLDLTPLANSAQSPVLKVQVTGRQLHMVGSGEIGHETIDITADRPDAPTAGDGTLKLATSIGGRPCGADYKASVTFKR